MALVAGTWCSIWSWPCMLPAQIRWGLLVQALCHARAVKWLLEPFWPGSCTAMLMQGFVWADKPGNTWPGPALQHFDVSVSVAWLACSLDKMSVKNREISVHNTEKWRYWPFSVDREYLLLPSTVDMALIIFYSLQYKWPFWRVKVYTVTKFWA